MTNILGFMGGATQTPPPPLVGFVTHWRTNNSGLSNPDQIALPLTATGTYNFNVDWGDGNADTITVWNQAETTHTYASAGSYYVSITGQCDGWSFGFSTSDSLKLLKILNWGSLTLGNDELYFAECSNLTITATDILDLTGTTDLIGCFVDCTSLTSVPNITLWDFSSVTNLAIMFANCPLFNQPLDSLDVSNVTSLSGIFQGCSLFNQNLNSWVTTSCTDIGALFADCPLFNGNITSWDTSNVTNMTATFQNCHAFNQNINGWNVSAVTDMSQMFAGLTGPNAFNQDLNSWDVSHVKTMSLMFFNCTAFNGNITGWTTTALTNMNATFNNCPVFNQAIGGWHTNGVTTMTNMFVSATSFDQDLSTWNVTNITGTGLSGFLSGVELSTANYDALLVAWNAQAVHTGVTFDAGNSTYTLLSAAATARAHLIAVDGWTITDGGGV